MRWGDFRESTNIEDRTGEVGGGFGGFGGGGIRLGGGALVVVVIASLLFGVNPLEILGMLTGGEGGQVTQEQTTPSRGYGPAVPTSKEQTEAKQKVARVLGDTEDVWSSVFKSMGARYDPPKLVLFTQATQSACGRAVTAVGPFYCPGDHEVYLDTSFFDELARRFGAPGDFAQAYVVAHEVGHHVQNLMGIMDKFDQQAQRDPRSRNALSVRLELQADCFAGVWGSYAKKRNLLDPGDIEAGLRAAAAVGDDRIQKKTQGMIVPESFTHGSAEQRTRWFKAGLDSGDVRNCNTFAARDL